MQFYPIITTGTWQKLAFCCRPSGAANPEESFGPKCSPVGSWPVPVIALESWKHCSHPGIPTPRPPCSASGLCPPFSSRPATAEPAPGLGRLTALTALRAENADLFA